MDKMSILLSKANKAIKAGMLIGLGGLVYLSVDYKVFGAFLFSFGLITIIAQGYSLYTGAIGHFAHIKEIPTYMFMLVVNLLGAWVIGLVAKYCTSIEATTLVTNKLSQPLSTVFIMSMVCGVLMHLGVTTTKATKNPLYASMAVMLFILIGAEHCIANMFYFTVDDALSSLEAIKFMVVNILGNSLGAISWATIAKLPTYFS